MHPSEEKPRSSQLETRRFSSGAVFTDVDLSWLSEDDDNDPELDDKFFVIPRAPKKTRDSTKKHRVIDTSQSRYMWACRCKKRPQPDGKTFCFNCQQVIVRVPVKNSRQPERPNATSVPDSPATRTARKWAMLMRMLV